MGTTAKLGLRELLLLPEAAGFSRDELTAMTVSNPARLFKVGEPAAWRPRARRRAAITGPVPPHALGWILMREHVLCDITPPDLAARSLPGVEITLENSFEVRHHWCRQTGNNRLADRDIAIAELVRLKEIGGAALVELACGGIKPDPVGLRAASQASGIEIITGSG